MDILLALIPIAILLGLGAVTAFVWAISSGQLDDLETPALRLLTDDDELGRAAPDEPSRPPQTMSDPSTQTPSKEQRLR